MKKILFILLIFLVGCISDKPFCGISTLDACETNQDCTAGGCSSQICQSKDTEPAFTTCEFKSCYEANLYNLRCQCVENKCQWA